MPTRTETDLVVLCRIPHALLRRAPRVLAMSSREPLTHSLFEFSPPGATGSESALARTILPPGKSVWLDGNAVMCTCPECLAPISIRLWLMIADCWRCGTNVELTEEQEREVIRLLQQKTQLRHTESSESPAIASRVPAARTQPPDTPVAAPPVLARPQAAAPTIADRQPHAMHDRRRRLADIVRLADLVRFMPAWLVSLIFHLVVLTLLGLCKVSGERTSGPFVTLSTVVSRTVLEGGDRVWVDPRRELAFDLPVPRDTNLDDPEVRESLVRADQDARELRLDPDAKAPYLPDLAKVRKQVQQTSGVPATLAARDPRIRVEMVAREGGTTLTEASVSRGLRWLAGHQNKNGSWSLDAYNISPGCTCTGVGLHSDSAATSLALFPFLGAGQTHLVGPYRDTVSLGLRWLISAQKRDGDLRESSTGNSGMYAHGQAAIVLCEAYLMTGDEAFRDPAQRAIDFIVAAQHPAGGWRYQPGQEGDTSVFGWQLMALQSARAAGLSVPPRTFEMAGRYLNTVAKKSGGLYSYQPFREPTHVMTAEALLCRFYLGWGLDTTGVQDGLDFLINSHPPTPRDPDFYYWYYATQTLHHAGGPQWTRWNQAMRDTLVSLQERRGHEAGSWRPLGPHGEAGGRLYSTALAICTLEVYYRHLPIFRQLRLD